MKRVKNPPIPLKNFASIESMREEINEVVAFLQNPKAFQEMGARAPRVCCFTVVCLSCGTVSNCKHAYSRCREFLLWVREERERRHWRSL